MIGYHYSNEVISIDNIITSNQHKARTFDLVYKVYNQINPIPNQFGYAYPTLIKNLQFKYIYEVETDHFIKGNLNHSVFFVMDSLSSQSFNKKTLPLKDRLKMREEFLYQQAEKYFSNITPEFEKDIELISDSWVIKKIL